MNPFVSRTETSSESFATNRAEMLALVERLREIEGRAAALSELRKPRFRERGQLTPRERLARLLDPGMPFLELYNLANYLVEDTDPTTSVPGASAIIGIGFVEGVRCLVHVDDSGIRAGAATAMSAEKLLRALDLARRQKLPYIHLVESAGADLTRYFAELWAKGGGVFAKLAKLSAAGIPTFSVLHGPSTAGGAYHPGMSDYVVGVRGVGMAALAGAALVRAATGEDANSRELGGSEMHATVSGLVEYLAEDDADALLALRRLVAQLRWNDGCPRRDPQAFDEPRYSPDEIAGVVPVDYRQSYDVREVAARLVDGSFITDFKPGYGPATVCMHAAIYGHPVGIVANNGPIDPNGATKAAQFIQLCDQSNLPLVFLNNTTGYMVGTEYEQAGMIKHGAKMIQAVTNARVPKLTMYIGASFGAGNYGMCGHAYEPDFLFTWPNATTGVMGGEQAARTMELVVRDAAERRGRPVDEEELAATSSQIIDHFTRELDPFVTSGRMLDDGMIDPRDARKVLGFALETCWEARHRQLRPNTFGVARM